jgi:RHS repeat-associated protein
VSDFQYGRRPDGQILTVAESVKQPDGTFVDTDHTYTYDALNRLTREEIATSAAGGDYATDYVLDLVGNRVRKVTAKEGGAVERVDGTFDARDRLTEEKVYDAAVGGTLQDTITYGYDHNGSLTLRQPTTGSRTQQTWDLRNRLTGATVSQFQSGVGWAVQTSASYQYTADGIRSRVTENTVPTLYTIDGLSPTGYAQVVEERTAGGVLVASYVYGASLDPVSIHRVGAETGVYLGDGHSGVRQVLNAAGGTVFAAYRYDAFGNKVMDAGTFINPVGYRGERFDATLGQYYLRARFYDPRMGRFVQVDPFAANYSDPLQTMRYGYSGANPIMHLDPSGQFFGGGMVGFGLSLSLSTSTLVQGSLIALRGYPGRFPGVFLG